MMNVLFLGSGTSTGVPVIGCTCDVCLSENPKNKRLRSSILVKSDTTTILVDSCPDLRQQALRHHITAIDAIIYTHEHLDHIAGFDEMRAFCWRREDKLPLYAGTRCLEQLRRMFAWAFSEKNTYKGYIRPQANDHQGAPFTIGDIEVTPVLVQHAFVETYGYVFRCGGKSFGYVPDIKTLPAESAPLLRGLDALAMDALTTRDHHTHMSVAECVEQMVQLAPQHGFLTHCGHAVDYDAACQETPEFITPAYDGLEVRL
mgnify:CR=1 FL=1